MNILRLSLCNLRFRALASFFNVTVLALGIATIVTLLHVSLQMERRFDRDLQGFDLVVGAKGSPIQLILSSIFHLDSPSGNIPLDEALKIVHNPLVKTAIPVALGDSYRGFRIVGTSPDYPKHYNATLAQGAYWTDNMQAVLGSEVARASGLEVGGTFVGSHGLTEGGEEHTQFPYKVVGILAPTGTVADRLVFTDVGSVWNVHEHHHEEDEHPAGAATPGAAKDSDHDHDHGKEPPPAREITSLLLTYKSDYAAVKLPYLINKTSSMMAASPAVEMHRLWSIIGVGSETIRFFGDALVFIAGAGFFVTLWGAVADRRYDIALMRSLGATRRKIFSFVLVEGLTLGLLGVLLGLVLGHAFAWEVQATIEASRHMTLEPVGMHPFEPYLVLIALLLSGIVALIPAFMAYRMNVATVLSKNA
jgi:putative ABC transport system permease protein